MRRRREKNTLLPKMLGLAVLINAVLLPILAQFGVFKSMSGGQRLTPIELVKLPPAPKPPAPPKRTPKKQAAKPHPAEHKAAERQATAHRAPSGPPPVKVVAAGPGPAGAAGAGDAGITTSDSGPVVPPPPTPPATAPTPVETTPAPPVIPPVVPAQPPTPPVVPPHIPTLVAAVPVSKPEPTIPDDLREADLNATYEALFTVHPDGTATVKMVSGTGNPTLDALALDAARRWTFRPATRDGQPVESYLRLRIEFEVSA